MARLIIVLAVLATLMVGALAAYASEGISVQSTTLENRFPQEIVFRLEAQAPSEIKKITLTYFLGRGKSSAYGYPEFTPGRQVKAEFKLKTQANQYIPPGAKVRYYYLIEDADGGQLKTDEQTFIYEDTRFQWQQISRGLVTVYYHDDASPAAERILATSLSTLERMGKETGVVPTDPLKVIVYNSKREIDVALPFVSQTTREQLITLGEAHSDFDLVLMIGAGSPTDIEDTAAHELMHLISHQATDSAFSSFPVWLNEGLSVYAEGELAASHSYVRYLDQAIKENRVPPLRWLVNRPGKPDEVILFYGHSFSVTRYMIQKYGPEKMKELLAAFKAGESLENALKKTYGLTVDQLDADWRTSVGLAPVPVEAQAPASSKPASVPTLVPFGSKPSTGQAPAPTIQATPVPAAPAPVPTTPASRATDSVPARSYLLLVGSGAVVLVVAGAIALLVWRRPGRAAD